MTTPLLDPSLGPLSPVNGLSTGKIVDSMAAILTRQDWTSILRNAVHENNEDLVRRALRNGADTNAHHAKQNINALHIAVRDRRDWAIPLLVEAGANVEMRPLSPEGAPPASRPLLQAAERPNVCVDAMIEALLNAGARVDGDGAGGRSTLSALIENFDSSLLDRLHHALDLLIDAGAEMSWDALGRSFMTVFTQVGQPQTLAHLLSRGAAWQTPTASYSLLAQLDERLSSSEPWMPDHVRKNAVKTVLEQHVLRHSMSTDPSQTIAMGRPRSRL